MCVMKLKIAEIYPLIYIKYQKSFLISQKIRSPAVKNVNIRRPCTEIMVV